MYKKTEASFWTSEEVDLSSDKKDWDKLTPNERHFVSHVISFLAALDGMVNENLAMNFCCEIQASEAHCFYGFQMAIENVHSEIYALILDTCLKEQTEKYRLLNAIETVPYVRMKCAWAMKWCDNQNCSFAERIAAFAAVECILFCGSFCSMFWLKKRGFLPGVCSAMKLISRDEGMHCEFACLMYNKLANKIPQSRLFEIIDDAVKAETEFVKHDLPVDLIGMNPNTMVLHIQFCADRLLIALGCEKLYNATNPFDWMTETGSKPVKDVALLDKKILQVQNENIPRTNIISASLKKKPFPVDTF